MVFEISLGGKAGAAQQFADQDREPDFDLIEPGGVPGGEVESDAVAVIAQEGLTADFSCQYAIAAFAAKRSFIDAALARYQAHDAFRHVGVEIIANDSPRHGRRGRGEESLEERRKVCFGAGIGHCAGDFASGGIEAGDQRLGAMADIFELPPLDPRLRGGRLFPGLTGNDGAMRSSAWMPVISSIDTVSVVAWAWIAARDRRCTHRCTWSRSQGPAWT